MEEFKIDDADLAKVQGHVVVVTGGSSGIGLATVELLLSVGCHVVVGDVNDPPLQHANLAFCKTDVASWSSLLSLFKEAHAKHSRIDHAFANAGITTRADYLQSSHDPNTGDLLEPSQACYDVNLRGMINTCYIAMHYMRTQQDPPGGSIVCTASASSFQRFGVTDYATSKHAVLGFMRGTVSNLQSQKLPIRMNAIAPSWTRTGMVSKELCEAVGMEAQAPEAVARNVVLFMADHSRTGQLVYSVGGRYYEIEESILLPAGRTVVGGEAKSDEVIVQKIFAVRERARAKSLEAVGKREKHTS